MTGKIMKKMGFEINEDGQIEWRNNGGVVERKFHYAEDQRWTIVANTPETPRTASELKSFCDEGGFGYEPPEETVGYKCEITFDGPGEYGIHDGFFNAIVKIRNEEYAIQCCTEDDGSINWNDKGFDWGISGDTNDELAQIVGWDGVDTLLKRAYEIYNEK